MPDPGLMTVKMRAYMEALSPTARNLLIRAMRSAEERGESGIPTQSILKAVAELEATEEKERTDASAPKPDLPWGEQLRQAFFLPVQPFVCDLVYPAKLKARVQSRSLDEIWKFLTRDFAPSAFAGALVASADDTTTDATALARKLRREFTPKLLELVHSENVNSKSARRVIGQLGSEMAFEDLIDVVYVFQKEGAFLNFTGQLPKSISAFELSDAGPVSELTKKAIDGLQLDPAFLAVAMIPRCTSVASIARLAMTLAGTTDPRYVHSSPYTQIVDAVISEVELWVHRFENHLKDRPKRLKSLEDLREYHDLVRQLDLALQPNQVPAWHRRLGAARKQMSAQVGREIEPLPGLIRRSLRVETAAGGFSGQFDQETANDAEFAIKLLFEARNTLDSLALNELVTKLRRPVEQTVEVITAKLMAEFKSGAGSERSELLKAVDASIRMSATVFGDDYAALLRKSRDIALNKPAKSAMG